MERPARGESLDALAIAGEPHFCGDGPITELRAAAKDGAFSVDLDWTWQGAGPSGGTDPATFSGTVVSGVVDGSLTWGTTVEPVHAVLGDPAGKGLGVANCPLD